MKTCHAFILTLLFFLCAALENQGWSAEKIEQRFGNVNEVIGWIKGKGKCTQTSSVVIALCSVQVVLPSKDSKGTTLSPGWTVEGSLRYLKFPDGASYVVADIVRTKRVLLSTKDPNAAVVVRKQATYDFNSRGELEETKIAVTMKNFRGEEMLNLAFPVPRRTLLKEENLDDFALLATGFQFDWDWTKELPYAGP